MSVKDKQDDAWGIAALLLAVAVGAILSWAITHAVMKPKPPAAVEDNTSSSGNQQYSPAFTRSSSEPRADDDITALLIYRSSRACEDPFCHGRLFTGTSQDLVLNDWYEDPSGWRQVTRITRDAHGVMFVESELKLTLDLQYIEHRVEPKDNRPLWWPSAAKPAARPPAACCAGSPSCIKSQNDYLRAMIECKHKDKADKPPTSGVRNNARICGPGCLEWDPPWVIDKGHYTNKVETNEVKVQTYEDHCVVCVPNDECKPCEQQPSFAPMCNGDACSWTIN